MQVGPRCAAGKHRRLLCERRVDKWRRFFSQAKMFDVTDNADDLPEAERDVRESQTNRIPGSSAWAMRRLRRRTPHLATLWFFPAGADRKPSPRAAFSPCRRRGRVPDTFLLREVADPCSRHG